MSLDFFARGLHTRTAVTRLPFASACRLSCFITCRPVHEQIDLVPRPVRAGQGQGRDRGQAEASREFVVPPTARNALDTQRCTKTTC